MRNFGASEGSVNHPLQLVRDGVDEAVGANRCNPPRKGGVLLIYPLLPTAAALCVRLTEAEILLCVYPLPGANGFLEITPSFFFSALLCVHQIMFHSPSLLWFFSRAGALYRVEVQAEEEELSPTALDVYHIMARSHSIDAP